VIETCIKNKEVHWLGILKMCLMYKKVRNGNFNDTVGVQRCDYLFCSLREE
jgi:hypothetical protein